jgi:hypothetical protein
MKHEASIRLHSYYQYCIAYNTRLPKMMSRNLSFSAVLAVLLSTPAAAFAPSSRLARKSSLSMSAALIVQNKGGGHGELGESITMSMSTMMKERF